MSKKNRKIETVRESLFWKPLEEGDAIEGTFRAFQPTQTGMAIGLTSGELVGLSWQLHEYFKGVYKTLVPEKTLLHIEYAGKRGRMKSYHVWIDKKQLSVPTGFGVASPKQVNAFFETPAQELSERISESIKKGRKGKK